MENLAIDKLFNVRGLVFVITGGGSGLGETMALALDQNGASKVFVLGRRLESLEKVAAKAINTTVVPIQCDVTSKAALLSAVKTIEEHTPFVNIVIANSGIIGPVTSVPPRPADASLASIQDQLWNTSLEDSQQVINVNTLAPFYTFAAFMGLSDAGNRHPDSRGTTENGFVLSQYVTILSLASFSRKENVAYQYMASKAALVHLDKSLATNFGPMGIRVNGIAPGFFVTETTEFMAQGTDFSKPGMMPKESIPLTRLGSPENIAGAILYLTSRAGAFLNGNVILVDGGTTGNEPSTY